MSAPEVRRSFWSVARTPRMIGLLLILLLAAGVCGRLGAWQLDRAHERGQLAAKHAEQEARSKGPIGLGVALPPQSQFPGRLVGRQVWVNGTYEPAGQLLVASREVAGKEGYLVLTPLRVSDDGTSGKSWQKLSGPPVIPVVRGWVATPDDTKALAVPSGQVRLVGYLQASEAAGERDLPSGQTDAISTGTLVNQWGGPMYSGYLVLHSASPAQASAAQGGPVLAPRPTIEGGKGLNLQNAFYAIQWWVFGAFAVLLWVRTVRDEARGVERRGRGGGIAGLPPVPDADAGPAVAVTPSAGPPSTESSPAATPTATSAK